MTLAVREEISRGLAARISHASIALLVGYSSCSIGREVRRHSVAEIGYRAPLIEDNSVRSKATSSINANIGYKFNRTLQVKLDGFNLTNKRASAIDYYYTSRLPGEAAEGVADIHFHPIESRTFRLSLSMNF